jgi:hypothetical protein
MTMMAFIVGPSRSGKSVLTDALGRDLQIIAIDELNYGTLCNLLGAAGSKPGYHGPGQCCRRPANAANRAFRAFGSGIKGWR